MSEIQEKIKLLTEPWQKSEIKWRVGAMTKDKAKDKAKAKPLAYIDARNVMERLDAAVGVENWQDRYEFHGTRTICYLSIRLGDEWICKSDGAGDSDIEGEKGGLSDAFKRASVKWGMGRELYELKTRWMPVDEYKQLVGNPWDFVIKNNNTSKVAKVEKDETPEELANRLMLAFADAKSLERLTKIGDNEAVKAARAKLFKENSNLAKKVDDHVKECKLKFATQSPSGL